MWTEHFVFLRKERKKLVGSQPAHSAHYRTCCAKSSSRARGQHANQRITRRETCGRRSGTAQNVSQQSVATCSVPCAVCWSGFCTGGGGAGGRGRGKKQTYSFQFLLHDALPPAYCDGTKCLNDEERFRPMKFKLSLSLSLSDHTQEELTKFTPCWNECRWHKLKTIYCGHALISPAYFRAQSAHFKHVVVSSTEIPTFDSKWIELYAGKKKKAISMPNQYWHS